MTDRIIPRRLELEVYLGQGGHVVLRQENWPDEDSFVYILPDDVAKVVRIMRSVVRDAMEAASEIEGGDHHGG